MQNRNKELFTDRVFDFCENEIRERYLKVEIKKGE